MLPDCPARRPGPAQEPLARARDRPVALAVTGGPAGQVIATPAGLIVATSDGRGLGRFASWQAAARALTDDRLLR